MNQNRKAKFRLQRIRVKEVSGVDRPANLEPFLIVKRDSMADETQTEETEKAVPPPPPAPAAAPPAPPAPPAPQPAPQAGKLGPLSTATKDMVLEAAKSTIESIQGIAMAVGEAPTDDNATAPPELAASFTAAMGKLQQLVQAVSAPPPPPAAPAPPAAPQPPPATPAMKAEVPSEEALKTIVDGLATTVAKSIAQSQAELRGVVDKLVTTVQVATAKTVLKSGLPIGNGQRGDEDPEPKKAPHVWPDDIAESAKKRAAR